MNIHFYKTAGGAFKAMPTARGHIVSKDGTQPPRTRVGLKVDAQHPHNVYPGGKALRRARLALSQRQASRLDIISEISRTKPTIANTLRNIPGSMQA